MILFLLAYLIEEQVKQLPEPLLSHVNAYGFYQKLYPFIVPIACLHRELAYFLISAFLRILYMVNVKFF